ncbi:MAG: hypothetical protein E3J72_00835 [Planctomycetota bacterium]|nr:MAG: hypothetical protein E3J72_00835 [Planctomycetota bacterium]
MEYRFMFDTNIFDKILESKIEIADLPSDGKFFVTHIQEDEINKISAPEKQEKKHRLTELFNVIPDENIATTSAVVGVSRIGGSRISGKSELRTELHAANKGKGKIKDTLIGETAIKNDCILVTEDVNFRDAMIKVGGRVIAYTELVQGKYRDET